MPKISKLSMLGKLSFGSRIPPEQTRQQRVVEYKKIIHFSFFLEERERAKKTKTNDRVLKERMFCLFLTDVDV